MDVRSRQRKISFDLLADARLLEEIVGDDDVDGFLSRSISVPDPTAGAKKRRRKRRNKKAAECQLLEQSIPDVEESVDESVITEHGELRLNGDVDIAAVPLSLNEGSRCDENECRVELNGMDSHEARALCFESSGIVGTFCVEVDSERSAVSIFSSPELRQRTATGATGIHVHASMESNQLESDGNIDRVEVDSVKSALMDRRKQMIDGSWRERNRWIGEP